MSLESKVYLVCCRPRKPWCRAEPTAHWTERTRLEETSASKRAPAMCPLSTCGSIMPILPVELFEVAFSLRVVSRLAEL